MKKRLLSLALCLALVLSLLPTAALATETNMPFTDVKSADWFYDAVQYSWEKGMMTGTGDTTFSPNATTTRGMIVTILHRMEGISAASGVSFTDVADNAYYANGVAWASANDIVGGYGNGKFGPEDPITREQMATILYRYSEYKGYDVTGTADLSTFTDADTVSDYATAAMAWANAEGLITGMTATTLVPQGNATRAQVATILMRFCETVVEEPASAIYTVTFVYNYDNLGTYTTQKVSSGEKAKIPDTPTRSGYTFNGWYTQATGGSKFDFDTEITKDITLYAQWSKTSSGSSGSDSDGNVNIPVLPTPFPDSYTVTFNSNGGSNVVAQTVKDGEVAIEPAAPTRDGFIFDGWYEDAECTELYDFEFFVLEDIELYAGWREPGPYSISFDSAGGSAVPTQTVEENQVAVKPEDPDRAGYIFLGWLTEDDAYFEFDEVINRNLALTADWIEESEFEYVLDDILGVNSLDTIEQTLSGDGSITGIEVSYKLNDAGKVTATQIMTGPMLRIPGCLAAVDINALGGAVTDAVIAFHYDPAQLAANGINPQDLAIVWYDEENDIVVLLESQVDTLDSIVSVETGHFSEYAVVNIAEWMAAQTAQLPTIRTDETPYYSIVLSIDCSGSMSGEKMQKSIEAAQNMIDVLADEDRITLLAFTSSTRTLLDQVQLVSINEEGEPVDNRNMIKAQIASLYASGGTNIESALQRALQSKSDDTQYQSFVILLSDGQSSVSDSVLASLKANNQRVIAVGIGSDVAQSLMQRIATATDGAYLYCQNASDLASAFKALQDAYIGSTEDSDGDGLPDLVETTGMRDQYGEIWTTDPNNPDSDGDGLSDSEEMGLYHPLAQHPYFQRVSRPDLYTVKSDEAYLLMPEHMMYSLDMANNKLKLEVYVSDGGYRMVPDLLTPPDPDGIPKEYIYSPPQNLKVELSGLPDGVVIDSLETVNKGFIPGTLTTTYKTTAILSYTKSVVLENVTWTVTADNCSEWSGFAENGIKATYVQKTQSVPATKVNSKEDTSKSEQARKDLAQAALDIVKKLYSKAEAETSGIVEDARTKVKDMMHTTLCHKGDTVSDEVYDAFAMAILDSLDSSAVDTYETKMDKLSNQLYGQIKASIKSDETTVTINKTRYTISYFISTMNKLGVGTVDITWRESSGKSHSAHLTWENISSKDGSKALADYCAALAQLNQGVWRDFLSYYVRDTFDLMGITTVTAQDIDRVFIVAEKTIKALCNKDDANALIKEMGGKIGEQLQSGLTNKFKSFIKDNIPNGDKIVRAAELYNTAKKKYDEFQKFLSSSDSEKATQAFSAFEKAYEKLEAEINSI